MIYPTIHFTDKNSLINIYDTEFSPEPVLSLTGVSQYPMDTFYTLLSLLLNQYTSGFNEGYEVGFEDAETEGDITYGEYDE